MALIDCPECGAEVSDSAYSCLHCACPIAEVGGRWRVGRRRWRPSPAVEAVNQIVGRVALAGVLFASGAVWEAPPVVISAVVVVGSALRIWGRMRRGDLPGGFHRAALEGLQARVTELEDQQANQATEAEQYARQVGELEERLDFTERLLTRRTEEGTRA